MDLQKEQEYIRGFVNGLSDDEFVELLEECGHGTIMPTRIIHDYFVAEGFYESDLKYVLKSSYRMSNKMQPWVEYEEGMSKLKREVAA